MTKKKTKYEHSIPVKCNGVSIKKNASISIGIDRENLELEDAERLFAGSQLEFLLTCDPNAGNDAEGQQTMDAATIELKGTANVGGFRTTTEHFACTLVLNKSAINIDTLAQFASTKSEIMCTRVGESNGDDDDE